VVDKSTYWHNRQVVDSLLLSSSVDDVVGDSSDDTSSERSEGVPQHDYDQESHHLAAQLGVSEAMIKDRH
jgi:hypothetical protein